MDRQAVHDDFDRARSAFRALLDGATDEELRRRSDGTRWNNRQLLFHMLLGFLIMRALLALARIVARLPGWVGRSWARLLNVGTRRRGTCSIGWQRVDLAGRYCPPSSPPR